MGGHGQCPPFLSSEGGNELKPIVIKALEWSAAIGRHGMCDRSTNARPHVMAGVDFGMGYHDTRDVAEKGDLLCANVR